jgi:hypothetical protein
MLLRYGPLVMSQKYKSPSHLNTFRFLEFFFAKS